MFNLYSYPAAAPEGEPNLINISVYILYCYSTFHTCFIDIDECATNTDNCDENALCTDTIGSFTCACNAGFSGNGVTCQGKST